MLKILRNLFLVTSFLAVAGTANAVCFSAELHTLKALSVGKNEPLNFPQCIDQSRAHSSELFVYTVSGEGAKIFVTLSGGTIVSSQPVKQ